MYFHASQIQGIEILKPHLSEHERPLVYFSTKRENVLVYLSNAVEKYCRETGFDYDGTYKKWGPYGFDAEGRQQIEEYYPEALIETYKGVAGYIYSAKTIEPADIEIRIPDAAVSEREVKTVHCEYIPDAYEALLAAQAAGMIRLVRYDEWIAGRKEWLKKSIVEEYQEHQKAGAHPEYLHFLKGKFGNILREFV